MSKVALPKWCTIVRSAPAVYERAAFVEGSAIRSPRDAVRVLRPRLERQEVEEFVVLALNSQHQMIAATVVTRGILNSSLVHPREVFRLAVAMGAAGYTSAQREEGTRRFAAEVLNVDERNARRWLSGERELQGTVRVVCAAIVARPELARELAEARATLVLSTPAD